MPITSPSASSSGPPELPGLIAASVWIAPSIGKSVSDSIERSVAETTPTESDCSSPNGLPIAATGSPTCDVALGCRASSGCRSRPVGVDLEQRDVGVRVEADDLGRDLVAVGELDVDLFGLVDRLPPPFGAAVGDHVGVGDDLAVARRPRSRSPGRRLPPPPRMSPPLPLEDRDDRHHAGRGVLVDRGGVEAAVRRPGSTTCCASCARRSSSRTVAVVVAAAAAAAGDQRRRGDAAGEHGAPSTQRSRPPRAGGLALRSLGAAGERQAQREGGVAAAASRPRARRPCAARARGRSRGPSPEPGRGVAGVEALEDRSRSRAGRCPAPSSATISSAPRCVPRTAVTVDRSFPAGVCVSALSMQDTHDLRDPLRVGERDHLTAPVAPRAASSCALGRRPRTRPPPRRASVAAGRPARARSSSASASSRERSSRSVVSFCSRSTCSRIVGARTRRVCRVELLVLEQLDEAAEREDRRAQLVRGVGDELLARAVEPREPPLHLVEGARELAELVGGVDRDRRREVALGDRLGGRARAGASRRETRAPATR